MSAEKTRLPFHVQRVIDRCKAGQTLCVQHRVKATGEPETLCYFEPSGRSAGTKSAIAATATGLLRPAGDGLFGAESSQTWTAA